MFTLESVVDTVQEGKKQFIRTFMFGEKFKSSMINLVDAQTQVYQTLISWGKTSYEEASKKVVNLNK